jgi:CheY-like chemotaxis protein
MRTAPSDRAPRAAVILLVDDNNDGILARRSVLEEFGYTVVAASCGETALEIVQQQGVDLVITDLRMKPVNGIELIKSLREIKPQLPVILLTGFADTLGLSPETTGASVVLQKSSSELTMLLRNTKRLLQPPRKPMRAHRATNPAPKAKGTGR